MYLRFSRHDEANASNISRELELKIKTVAWKKHNQKATICINATCVMLTSSA